MLEKLVAFCLRWPWTVVLFTLALSGAGAYETVGKFQIDTDTVNLFSSSLPWRQNENRLYKEFPETVDLIVAVIDADTPEKADKSARQLREALTGKPLMQRVWQPDDNAFFRKNGLLFLKTDELEHTMGVLGGQRDVLQPLAEDPSLRGLASVMLVNQKRAAPSKRATTLFYAGLDAFSDALKRRSRGRTRRSIGKSCWMADSPRKTPTSPRTKNVVWC